MEYFLVSVQNLNDFTHIWKMGKNIIEIRFVQRVKRDKHGKMTPVTNGQKSMSFNINTLKITHIPFFVWILKRLFR